MYHQIPHALFLKDTVSFEPGLLKDSLLVLETVLKSFLNRKREVDRTHFLHALNTLFIGIPFIRILLLKFDEIYE